MSIRAIVGFAFAASAFSLHAQTVKGELESCTETLGTLTVVEDRNAAWYHTLRDQYKVQSTVPLIRMLVQKSNCFVVVERGAAMNNMRQERELERSGEMREGSDFGKGQMVAADYSMNPTITFSERDTGGIAAAEGNSSKTDINVWGGLFGGGAAGGAGGYTNTPEGKVLASAFADAYNNLVKAAKNYKAQEVKGGLGTGGRLGVSGGRTPASKGQ